ncbi:MAG: hypothetical protein JNL32_11035 [Candidatus Kapabacteria bacterium]|nr:hypothetical protein [Candidatus Kapabacteria bacterium]
MMKSDAACRWGITGAKPHPTRDYTGRLPYQMQNHLSTYTDSELLALAHSDASLCDAVFSEVYDRHSKRMYAYALRVTGRGDDANLII